MDYRNGTRKKNPGHQVTSREWFVPPYMATVDEETPDYLVISSPCNCIGENSDGNENREKLCGLYGSLQYCVRRCPSAGGCGDNYEDQSKPSGLARAAGPYKEQRYCCCYASEPPDDHIRQEPRHNAQYGNGGEGNADTPLRRAVPRYGQDCL